MAHGYYLCNLSNNEVFELPSVKTNIYNLRNYIENGETDTDKLCSIIDSELGIFNTTNKLLLIGFIIKYKNLKFVFHEDTLCESTFPTGDIIYINYSIYTDFVPYVRLNLASK